MTKACAKLPSAYFLGVIDEENNKDTDFDLSVEDLSPSADPVVIMEG